MTRSLFLMAVAISVLPSSLANTLQITNNCPYPLYFWTVPTGKQVSDHDHQVVPGYGGSLVHPMSHVSTSLKIRDLPFYERSPAGIIQAEYEFDPHGQRWFYDLSYIDCDQAAPFTDPMHCPFAHSGVSMYTTGSEHVCKVAHCQLGGHCENTYLIEGPFLGEPSLNCAVGNDLFLETCVDGPGVQSNPYGNTLPIPGPQPEYPPQPQPEYGPPTQPEYIPRPEPVPPSHEYPSVQDLAPEGYRCGICPDGLTPRNSPPETDFRVIYPDRFAEYGWCCIQDEFGSCHPGSEEAAIPADGHGHCAFWEA